MQCHIHSGLGHAPVSRHLKTEINSQKCQDIWVLRTAPGSDPEFITMVT